jgi:ABC-type transport system substrate-binding protein
MSWTRRDVLALGSLALAGAALGPSRVAAQTPKRGGTLTIRGWDPPLFDPMLTTAYRVHVPLSFTHSRLVRHRAGPSVPPGTFPIEGDLAESWTQQNETTYVFKLRRGVRWHP